MTLSQLMPAVLFRCPNTRLRVQGWAADDQSQSSGDRFEPLTCHACGQVHLVNPKTGRTLGDDSEHE